MIRTNNSNPLFMGVVEDRNDPLHLGRVKVRVVGLHTHKKVDLPTDDLPWARDLQSPTMAGTIPLVVEGAAVCVMFMDFPECQMPIVVGTLQGIPQQKSVHVDEFEKTPIIKDSLVPQGRNIPKDAQENTGGHVGPILDPKSNAAIQAIEQQSQQTESPEPEKKTINTLLKPQASALRGAGKFLSAIGGLGSTANIAENAWENLILGEGGTGNAIEKFTRAITQANKPGSAISAILNTQGSLKSLKDSIEFGSVQNIQSAFKRIKNADIDSIGDVFGVVANAETILNQSATTITDVSDVVTTIFDAFSQVTVEDTIGGVEESISDTAGAITGEFSGILSAGVSQAQEISDFLGGPDLTPVQEFLAGAAPEEAVSQGVSAVTETIFGGQEESNPVEDKPSAELTQEDFKNVAEGSTPPVYGAFGGPNFAGAEPPVVEPSNPAEDPKYQVEPSTTREIPITPPPGWNGSRADAQDNIQILIAACTAKNFTTEQTCALLGIVGGECGWIPQAENEQYSDPGRLMQIFQSTFKNNRPLAEQYSNWRRGNKGTKEQFFNFVYDPKNNGRQLGNSRPGDGGRYYGRGFLQLTGRENYVRYAKMSGHPIDENPDLLISDKQISADIAVLYFLDRVRNGVPTSHPGYFYAAKRAVGNNSPDIAQRKLSYYEYFYGVRAPESYGFGQNQAGSTQSPYGFDGRYRNSDRNSGEYGFQDPNSKYPLNRKIYQQETSPLARGEVGNTIVQLKESQRLMQVPTALNGPHWDQPETPYGAQYPYNHVVETESGHVTEHDDTPGYERTHHYHRSGTFEEIDANGTLVRRIVGDGYVIYDRNGYISVAGDCNVTVTGNVNVYCQSDANIEVCGSAEMKVGGNMDIGVAKDMNIACQGDFSVWSNGSVNLQAAKNVNHWAGQSQYMTAKSQVNLQSDESTFIQSNSQLHMRAEASANIQSGDDVNVVGGGNTNIEGALINLNTEGAAAGAEASGRALLRGMIPPATCVGMYPNLEPLAGPELMGEDNFTFELPGDGNTLLSRTITHQQALKGGNYSTFQAGSAAGTGGGGTVLDSPLKNEILNTSRFTADFKLSEHFTLGMMFDGGFNNKHKLPKRSLNGLTPQEIVANLSSLAFNVLEKYLQVLPGGIEGYGTRWKITSGYRQQVGRSDHPRGRAVDIALIGGAERKELHWKIIQEMDKLVKYDQLLLEYNGKWSTWMHTGFRGEEGRGESFTMRNHRKYGDGFILLT